MICDITEDFSFLKSGNKVWLMSVLFCDFMDPFLIVWIKA